MVGWGGAAGWGGFVVMIMAMAGFWALVVGATMALFRGVHYNPTAHRRTNPRVRMTGEAASDSRGSRARTLPVRLDTNLPSLEPSSTPPGTSSGGPSANLHGKPGQTFVRRADCEAMGEVETIPSWGRQGRGATGGSAPTQGRGLPVAVTLVEAPACHLCEDAKSALAVLAQSYPMTVQVVSIGGDPGRALMQEHRAPMSPLVLLDGEYFSSGRLPRRKLEKRLAKAWKVRPNE
jgi:Glutaredoxin-like domain (DUF836)